MTDPSQSVTRIEDEQTDILGQTYRRVKILHAGGSATFARGRLMALDLGVDQPHPVSVKDAAGLTDYIQFLRFVRAEVRRLADGAQEQDQA